MKQKYIVTNIDQTVQRVTDEDGQLHWLSPEESLVMTNPPASSYSFKVEELLAEAENMIKVSKDELLNIIETYVQNKKVLTNKEWKGLGNNLSEEAKILYNSLETYTLNKHVLSRSEFEKLKGEKKELNEMEVKK